jgi:dihydroorotate dehydrogenase electron transfer subunit
VLVAGGTGIASIHALAARLARGCSVEVLLGARTASDLMGEGDFADLGVTLRVATEDGSQGHRGLVTELLAPTLEAEDAARVYACGPTGMMRRCAEIAARRSRPCTVSLENPMACGFGVCLGCAAPLRAGGFALVCRDGPVFDASAIDWEGLA